MIDSQDPAMLGFAGLCEHKRGESEGDKGQSTEFGVHQKSSRDDAPLSLLQVLGLFGCHASRCVFADQPRRRPQYCASRRRDILAKADAWPHHGPM
jgi:hypothetical protein